MTVDNLKWILTFVLGIALGGGFGNYLATGQVDTLRKTVEARFENVDSDIMEVHKKSKENEKNIAVKSETLKNIEGLLTEMRTDIKEIKKEMK